MYVNNNGVLSFDSGISAYVPLPFPLTTGTRMVAGLWTDVDTRADVAQLPDDAPLTSNRVYYRVAANATDPAMARAASDVRGAFPNEPPFTPAIAVVATYYRVAAYPRQTAPLNTFQIVLASDGRRSFAALLYASLAWGRPPADPSSGTPYAQAGFNAGDGRLATTLPGSFSANVTDLPGASNVGRPGLFLYRVDATITTAACGGGAGGVLPARGPVFGGQPLAVYGPCLNATDSLRCRFGNVTDGDVSVDVPAAYVDTTTATCAAPFSRRTGTVPVYLSRDAGASWALVGGYHYLAPEAPGLPPLLLRPGRGAGPGGPLLPVVTAAGWARDAWAPAPTGGWGVPLELSWVLGLRERAGVDTETLGYDVELWEALEPAPWPAAGEPGHASSNSPSLAWAATGGPRYAWDGEGNVTEPPLPRADAATRAALAAAAASAFAAARSRRAFLDPADVRRIGVASTGILGFGLTPSSPLGGALVGYWSGVVWLDDAAAVEAALGVRPVFVRLVARSTPALALPLPVRASNLRWMVMPGGSFSPHAACRAWHAVAEAPAAWNGGLQRCPLTAAQAGRGWWESMPGCDGGSDGEGGDSGGGGGLWGTAACADRRGRSAFSERTAVACVRSAAPNAGGAVGECCYDGNGTLLRSGAGAASDARFGASLVPLSHWFTDVLPRLVCCSLSPNRTDCDGEAARGGAMSWRGLGGGVGDPHFGTLDGGRLTFNGAGDFVLLAAAASPADAVAARVNATAALAAAAAAAVSGGGGGSVSALAQSGPLEFVGVVRLVPLAELGVPAPGNATVVTAFGGAARGGPRVAVSVRGGALLVRVDGNTVDLSPALDADVNASAADEGGSRLTLAALRALAARSRYAGGAPAGLAADPSASERGVSQVVQGGLVLRHAAGSRTVWVTWVGVGVRVTVRATPLRGGAYSLTVSADVPPRYFNATAGLLGDFDGVARNDLRTAVELPAGGGAGRLRARQLQAGGGAAAVTPRFTQRNAWEAVLARLSVPPAVSAALLLDPYPAPAVLAPPYVPVFTDEVHPATGAGPLLLSAIAAACGVPDALAPLDGMPPSAAACVTDAALTRLPEVGALTAAALVELGLRQAAALRPVPQFNAAQCPAALAVVTGELLSSSFTADVLSLRQPAPPATVVYSLVSTLGGACAVDAATGALRCTGLTQASPDMVPRVPAGTGADGTLEVVALETSGGGVDYWRVALTVMPPASGTSTPSPSATPSLSAGATPSSSGPPSFTRSSAQTPSRSPGLDAALAAAAEADAEAQRRRDRGTAVGLGVGLSLLVLAVCALLVAACWATRARESSKAAREAENRARAAAAAAAMLRAVPGYVGGGLDASPSAWVSKVNPAFVRQQTGGPAAAGSRALSAGTCSQQGARRAPLSRNGSLRDTAALGDRRFRQGFEPSRASGRYLLRPASGPGGVLASTPQGGGGSKAGGGGGDMF